ncbi:MAG: DMT family transporter [archaeon]
MKFKEEIYIILANVIFAFMGVFTRLINNDLLPITQVAYRLTIAAVIFFFFYSLKGTSFLKITKKELPLLFIAGFLGYGLMVVFAVYSLITTTYGNALTFLQLSSVFVIILGAVFLREKISRNAIFACILSFAGIIVAFRPDLGNINYGIFFAIISALFYSFYFIIIRKLKEIDIKTRLFYTTLFAGVFLLPVALVFEKKLSFSFGLDTLIYLIIMALMNIAGYYLMNLGIKKVEANIAGILTVVQTLGGIIIGVLLYNEPMAAFEIVGSGLIILSIIILNLR